MSSRQLRKLQSPDTDLKALTAAINADSNEEDEADIPQIKHSVFSMLSEDVLENSCSENNEEESKPVAAASKKKRKKKKKSKQLKKEADPSVLEHEDEIDSSVREVNQLLGEAVALPTAETQTREKSILAIEYRCLNADNEMKRIFGANIVENKRETDRRHRYRDHPLRSRLVNPKNTWPLHGLGSLGMELVEKRGSLMYFTFEHKSAYRNVQQDFWQAVESMHPDNIMGILQAAPYHVDTLLQTAEIFNLQEDTPGAADLIERAVLACESAFHPQFSLTTGNCRLDYRRRENRAFFLVVWRHINFISQRGCHRTALEFCKILLSLSPEADPLAVILAIDYFAIRSRDYSFVIKLFDMWNSSRNLDQLPSWCYSLALARFYIAHEAKQDTSQADQQLREALCMFPGVLLPLLEKCSVNADDEVKSAPEFNVTDDPVSLRQLQCLYVGRCGLLWKPPEVVHWLETNVRHLLRNKQPQTLSEAAAKRQLRFRSQAPRNVLRHILISDISEAKANLPPEVTHSAVMSFDPLPPTDGIESYQVRTRSQPELRGNPFGLFLRSLAPNFTPEQEAEREAIVGETAANLQERLNQVVAAMRNMLNTIQMTPPPREDQHDPDNDDPDNEDDWALD